MYDPIGRGLVQGGVFNVIGLTVEEQDEWTAVITEQVSATESPILGYETSLDEIFQWRL
jgi:hypothetical protein